MYEAQESVIMKFRGRPISKRPAAGLRKSWSTRHSDWHFIWKGDSAETDASHCRFKEHGVGLHVADKYVTDGAVLCFTLRCPRSKYAVNRWCRQKHFQAADYDLRATVMKSKRRRASSCTSRSTSRERAEQPCATAGHPSRVIVGLGGDPNVWGSPQKRLLNKELQRSLPFAVVQAEDSSGSQMEVDDVVQEAAGESQLSGGCSSGARGSHEFGNRDGSIESQRICVNRPEAS